MTIGERIKHHRIEAGATMAEAAERIGKTKQQWEQWESGLRVPGFGSLNQIAESLGVSVSDLVAEPATPAPVEVV